ncbi:MAG: VTT domain-containing protein [Limosilactobacillus sp.]|jgi:uncharacterized membrane protein YdjX (TVP38/TMEM64 family)|uniref:TVP38/TMEM64 family protein n=1 Tax=Limosilactobacillus sp. TaxID=2773925 RepID=UPI0025B8A207|nr:VTT domain-containing protein [Limosilactobacillus sp.]MCI1975553.1 VTT domain-containing protein [Limosilactobacillus sp.]MCI2031278.1 VTT domain-containing protein [Limosilactobacillus sp.]
MKKKPLNKKLLITVGVILAIIIVIFIYQNYKPEIDLLIHPVPNEKEQLLHMIRAHGIANSLLLLVLIAVLNSIPGLSNSVICILSGLCYGPLFGFIINWMGNVLGNCVVMSLIRQINFSKKMKHHKLIKSLMQQKHPLIGLTIGFMIPVVPSILVNYAGAQLNVNRKQYMAMVLVGMAPTSFLYAFGGDAIFRGSLKRIISAAICIVILIGIYLIVKKIDSMRKQRLDTEA